MAHDHDAHDHAAPSTRPAVSGPLAHPGLIAWVLGIATGVGFIALLGIAVLNGVVMMTYFNQLREKGLDIATVVTEGAMRRLRPVMMTATICAFGLVPLLLATGPGSEIQRPLAIVVISGLISSTLLTLFLLPIIYKAFHRPLDGTTTHSGASA